MGETMKIWVVVSVLLILYIMTNLTHGQTGHSVGHGEYQGWSSQVTGNCCNNQDCGVLSVDEWRETDAGTEILINGTWCPVKPEHFIITGKSPDATVAHACIQYKPYKPTCEQLLWFVGPARS